MCSDWWLCSGATVVAPELDGGAGHMLQRGSHLHWQLQFSDVLTRWRRFFHQMAAEQGQAGRAAVDTKLEVVVLQVSSLPFLPQALCSV